MQDTIENFELENEQTLENLDVQLSRVRTGRANPGMLSSVKVDAYGMPTPLNQMAQIGTPEARLITVSPYDKSLLKACEDAIRAQNLPFTFSNDGNIIRLTVAPLTEETRKVIVKEVKQIAENSKISVRNQRRKANDSLKKLQKDSEITEDELKAALDEIQKLTDGAIKQIDELSNDKSNQVMTI